MPPVMVPQRGSILVTLTRTTRSGSTTCGGGRKEQPVDDAEHRAIRPDAEPRVSTAASVSTGLRASDRTA